MPVFNPSQRPRRGCEFARSELGSDDVVDPAATGDHLDAAGAGIAACRRASDTAIGYQITFVEMVRQGTVVGSTYGNHVSALIVVAALMITVNYLLSVAATAGATAASIPSGPGADGGRVHRRAMLPVLASNRATSCQQSSAQRSSSSNFGRWLVERQHHVLATSVPLVVGQQASCSSTWIRACPDAGTAAPIACLRRFGGRPPGSARGDVR